MTEQFAASRIKASAAAAISVPLIGDPNAWPRLADFRSGRKSTLISTTIVRGVLCGADAFMIAALGLAIAFAYLGSPNVLTHPLYLATIVFASLVTVFTLAILGAYQSQHFSSALVQVPRLVVAASIVFGLISASVFFLKSGAEISRVWLAFWFLASIATLIASRIALAGMTRHWAREGRLYRRAVIYGGGGVTEEVIRELEADTSSDTRVCGIFDERHGERCPHLIAGYPRLGGLDDLVTFGRASRVDLVIVALPLAAEQRLADIAARLSILPVDIKLPARAGKLRFRPRTYSRVGAVAMIDLFDKPITDWGTVSKWIFDKVIAALSLAILSPVMTAVALAIKLDSRGPVLFRQKRYGFNNELVEIVKFRSMYTDRCDANAACLVSREDPRVTKVGRFIRKTSLDELPQLFNVLRGDLSLVGPRPHAIQAKAGDTRYDEVVDSYFARHKVKPGITGWAQINGWRGETDTKEKLERRVEHDLYYIENWSLLFDLYILLRTPFALLKSENAY